MDQTASNYFYTVGNSLDSGMMTFFCGKTILSYNDFYTKTKKPNKPSPKILMFRPSDHALEISKEIKSVLKFMMVNSETSCKYITANNFAVVIENILPVFRKIEPDAKDLIQIPATFQKIFVPLQINDFYSLEDMQSYAPDLLQDIIQLRIFNVQQQTSVLMQNEQCRKAYLQLLQRQALIWENAVDILEIERNSINHKKQKRLSEIEIEISKIISTSSIALKNASAQTPMLKLSSTSSVVDVAPQKLPLPHGNVSETSEDFYFDILSKLKNGGA